MADRDAGGITRRQAVAASLGFAGIAAAGAAPALARPRAGGPLKGKRVLVAIGEFSEALETYYMVYRLMEEGAKPVVAAAQAKMVQLVVHDFEARYSNYTEKLGYLIKGEAAYADVKAADYDGLLVPGGRGPEEIRQDKRVLDIVGHFLDKDLPLGAMCHGPQVLWAARPMKGRRIAACLAIKADVEWAGATFVDAPVVVDRKLVTSRGWPDLPEFMPRFVEVLSAK